MYGLPWVVASGVPYFAVRVIVERQHRPKSAHVEQQTHTKATTLMLLEEADRHQRHSRAATGATASRQSLQQEMESSTELRGQQLTNHRATLITALCCGSSHSYRLSNAGKQPSCLSSNAGKQPTNCCCKRLAVLCNGSGRTWA